GDVDHMRGFVLLRRWFDLDRAERLDDLIDAYERRLGTDGLVRACFDDMARERDLVLRRRLLTQPRHRLYLALTLNVEDHDDRMRLAAELFPDAEPGHTIADIVGELADREHR